MEAVQLVDEKLEVRERIEKVEALISQCPDAEFGDTPTCPLKHEFADGIYVRTIKIPAGMLITGKIHRHSHPNVLLKGRVTVLTECGGMEDLEGPLVMISPAGTKRALYTHTECEWTTMHASDETDLEILEKHIICDSYDDFELSNSQKARLEIL